MPEEFVAEQLKSVLSDMSVDVVSSLCFSVSNDRAMVQECFRHILILGILFFWSLVRTMSMSVTLGGTDKGQVVGDVGMNYNAGGGNSFECFC